MFAKILIANRGEIACRVIRTCQRLNIKTVAVYSDADRHALHVRLADESVHLGGAKATESYLNMDRVLAAAKQSAADAIHPGFGFLSENAEFVRRCNDAGIVFIGPTAATIEAMGSKSKAKALMDNAGVPVVPGYHGDAQDDARLAREAKAIGYPLMIKASAGGGGKGMRIVEDHGQFADALASARREASSAFGDDKVLLEKFITAPRHIEFQVFGDAQGNIVHLFERECSIQRRYQKILEETPSTFLDEKLRTAMGDAAISAAKAVEYRNAGTVEFIVGADREFYFMEMNTRLQVEHPVTEMVTGVDLVEWQLVIASGGALPLAQKEIFSEGHAIEVRLYAEDPERDFLPATGTVTQFATPGESDDFRIDSGIAGGDEISIHYDPMIAKIICRNDDRGSCIKLMQESLAASAVFGINTNIGLLRAIVANPEFQSGDYDTGFIDKHRAALSSGGDPVTLVDCIAAAARDYLDRQLAFDWNAADPYSPWRQADGWQANGQGGVRYRFTDRSDNSEDLFLVAASNGFRVRHGDREIRCSAELHDDDWIALTMDGETQTLRVRREADDFQVSQGTRCTALRRAWPFAHQGGSGADETHPGSPMPGRIVAIHVKQGDTVEPGQALLVLEGMKMEYTLKATVSGRIETVLHKVGEMVEAEVPLVDIATEN